MAMLDDLLAANERFCQNPPVDYTSEDIKASMKVAIILTLAKEKYPPYTKDEVFKEIFEQAENFKKNRIHSEVKYNMNVSDGISMAAEPDVEK